MLAIAMASQWTEQNQFNEHWYHYSHPTAEQIHCMKHTRHYSDDITHRSPVHVDPSSLSIEGNEIDKTIFKTGESHRGSFQ